MKDDEQEDIAEFQQKKLLFSQQMDNYLLINQSDLESGEDLLQNRKVLRKKASFLPTQTLVFFSDWTRNN